MASTIYSDTVCSFCSPCYNFRSLSMKKMNTVVHCYMGTRRKLFLGWYIFMSIIHNIYQFINLLNVLLKILKGNKCLIFASQAHSVPSQLPYITLYIKITIQVIYKTITNLSPVFITHLADKLGNQKACFLIPCTYVMCTVKDHASLKQDWLCLHLNIAIIWLKMEVNPIFSSLIYDSHRLHKTGFTQGCLAIYYAMFHITLVLCVKIIYLDENTVVKQIW